MVKMTAQQTYQQHLTHLKVGMRYGSDDRVALVHRVLDACGQPDLAYPVIHVCGTNGKGSTSIMIATLLQATDLTVGTFLSPALTDDREMIRVNGTLITYEDFNEAFEVLQQGLTQLSLDLGALSEFEIWFILAMIHFQRSTVSVAIIECGLGGEFDATNGLTTAAYDIFTHIDYDHMALLGSTIQAIATTKAQIIRPQAKVIDYPAQYPAVSDIIAQQATLKQATYYTSQNIDLTVIQADLTGTTVQWQGHKLQLSLPGQAQVQNLKTVLTFVQLYNQAPIGSKLTLTHLQKTLAHLTFSGRFQKLADQPLTYTDGGHNPDALRNLVALLKPYEQTHQLILVLGFLKDKNVQANLQILADLKAQVIATTPDNPDRALDAAQLATWMTQLWPQAQTVQCIPDIQAAVAQAQKLASKVKQPLIFIGGSFYVVKGVLPHA